MQVALSESHLQVQVMEKYLLYDICAENENENDNFNFRFRLAPINTEHSKIAVFFTGICQIYYTYFNVIFTVYRIFT